MSTSQQPLALRLPALPEDPVQLEELTVRSEASNPDIKAGNEARIIWNNPGHKVPTSLSVVYLHGFTASHGEGEPLHHEFSRRYGANLYLARLAGHGLKSRDAFEGLTPQKWLDSAAYAYAVGRRLGKKVLLMCTSTGVALSLYLASRFPEIFGIIAYSPLIDFYDPRALILTHPWGRFIARTLVGNGFMIHSPNEGKRARRIWYSRYRIEGMMALGQLIERTMRPETFEKVTQPFFMGYYYKNALEQDHKVSIRAMLEMFDRLGTLPGEKRKVAFPGAESHVINNPLTSKAFPEVKKETYKFAEEILGLKPAK